MLDPASLVRILLPLLLGLQGNRAQTPSQNEASWACPFSEDLCGWEVTQTSVLDPEAGLTDQGWLMSQSTQGDGYPLPNEQRHFLYLESLTELRSQLWSVSKDLVSEEQGTRISFSFWSRGGDGVRPPVLSLFLVHNDTDFVLVWSSSPLHVNASGLDDESGRWTTISLCLPMTLNEDNASQAKRTRLSFLGHLYQNSSLGLAEVKEEKSADCPSTFSSSGVEGHAKPEEVGVEEDMPHVAWRFMIILSLFLCFGALFLATMFIVFGAKKAPTTLRQRNVNVNKHQNPVFQFQYRRLDADTA